MTPDDIFITPELRPRELLRLLDAPARAVAARRTEKRIRVCLVVLAFLAGLAVMGLATGCASDLDDAEDEATEAVALQVWVNTWGYTLGPPPRVVIDPGTDPRCGPGRLWVLDGCYGGAFYKKTYTVALPRELPGQLSHELAHAASFRVGGAMERYSDDHTPEFHAQVCRAEFQHTQVVGHPILDGDCAPAAVVEFEEEQAP
jgi:hypothetical protein